MNLLEMQDEQLAAKVVADFDKAEARQRIYKDKWKEYYRLYKALNDPSKKRPGSNLNIPYTWAQVEQLKARAWQSLFGKTPYINFAANNPQDVDGARLMEDLVFWQMKEKIKLPQKFINALTSIFVYGTAIALHEWKYEEKQMKQKQPIIDPITGAQMGMQEVVNAVVSYDDPDIEFIPVDDFYPDPEGWDMDSCAYACTRVDRDSEYVKGLAKSKDGKGKYTLPDGFELDKGMIVQDFRSDVNGIPSYKDGTMGERNKGHELISYYTDKYKVVVLNRKYVILKEENQNYCQEKPFTRIVAFDQEKEFWGLSVVQMLEHLQNELNTIRNQRIDNVSIVLNRMWLKRRGADIDNSQLISKAGNIIEVDQMDDIESLQVPDVTSSAYQEENITKQDMQYITGVSDYARGATPQRKETATAINTMTESSNIVFNYMTMMIETTGLIPIADAIKKLNQQYVTDEKVFRLFDSAKGSWQFSQMTADQIQGDYDAVSASPRLESQKTKEARRDQLMQMFNQFMSNPATAQFINPYEAMVMIMKGFDIEDYEKMLVSPEQLAQQPQIDPMTGQPMQADPMQSEMEVAAMMGGMPNGGI